jgi:hypothetical protein
VAENNDASADTMYKQALLGTLGLGRMERDRGMVGMVLRARQECETSAAQPAPLDGEPVDRARGAAIKRPAGVLLWPPTVFDARK